jgi:leucyl-tRNA synthetase
MRSWGISIDWSREFGTHEPRYYRWTQWIFLQLYKRGLAYRKKAAVNWCPSCRTVLANEQAEGGECWRCHSTVEERELDQWFLRITAYQDQLLDDMAQLTAWPERVLVQQRNWIGRSPGAELDFAVEGATSPLRVFTTRIDTIYGATFMVLAPEHPRLDELLHGAADEEAMRTAIARLRAQDRRARQSGQVEKEGVFTGRYAVNPFSGERVPIWVGNFVLMGYGTGAIMAVPAHDQRDLEFARKYGLPVRVVIQPAGPLLNGDSLPAAHDGPGRTVNSDDFSALDTEEAKARMIAHAAARGIGRATVTYRLKDWLISRQRYWGTPIPVVYCETDGMVGVPEDQLPVTLPADAPFTGEGGNPLEKVAAFVEATCPRCGGPARRETDTMDTFVDSSW